LANFGPDRKLHLKSCALAQRRFNPDTAAMHLDDLLGDGKTKAGSAFGLGTGVVDLVELLEYALLLFQRYSGARVSHTDREVTVYGFGRDPDLTGVGELDGVADQVEQHLGEALLVANADRQRPGDVSLEREL